MILKANGMIDAKAITTANGFNDTTPDENLFTHKIFQKEKEKYMFLGWCNYNGGHYLAIELVKI